jgi:hypothetical protein
VTPDELARYRLKQGDDNPYDSPGEWPEGAWVAGPEWSRAAARGVLADLLDRRGIKQGFYNIDHDVRMEIVESLARIIRLAKEDAG